MVLGALFLVRSVLSLAKRNMTESFCVFWNLISLLMIFAGILLHPSELNSMISFEGSLMFLIAVVATLEIAFYLSKSLSSLTRRNRELTMQVSLLLHEVDRLHNQNAESVGDTDEEAAVRDQHNGLWRRRDRHAESDRAISG